jgi:HAMP domain-containing protein
MIDADMHSQVFESGAADDEHYTTIAKQLRQVRDANPKIEAIYTMVKSEDPVVLLFIVSADEDPETRAGLHEPYNVSEYPQMIAAFEGATYDEEIAIDKFGAWFSGYAPIMDADGQGVAIVGIDMKAQDVIDIQNRIKQTSVFTFALVYVGLFGAIFLIAFAITNPLRHITQAAQTLESGEKFEEEDLQSVTKGTDELAQLARVFSKMAVEIQAREANLKRQVEELKIEIDEAKKTRHVEQIVESDYFKELQANAKLLRQRAKRRDKETKAPEELD